MAAQQKHKVRVTEYQDITVITSGIGSSAETRSIVAYELQHVQYRCSCGWHTDAVVISHDNEALRTSLRRLAHEHALGGKL